MLTFDDTTELLAVITTDAAGHSAAVYFLGGIEITAAEYDAIQIAALDRYLNRED